MSTLFIFSNRINPLRNESKKCRKKILPSDVVFFPLFLLPPPFPSFIYYFCLLSYIWRPFFLVLYGNRKKKRKMKSFESFRRHSSSCALCFARYLCRRRRLLASLPSQEDGFHSILFFVDDELPFDSSFLLSRSLSWPARLGIVRKETSLFPIGVFSSSSFVVVERVASSADGAHLNLVVISPFSNWIYS